MKRQRIALALALSLFVPQVGCLCVSAQTPQSQNASALTRPAIEFVSPHANDRINDYPIFVETRVTGFTLEPPVQYWDRVQPADKLVGHIHYTLDDSPIFATRATHIVMGKPMGKSLPKGTHILRAELVNINHNPLNPPVYVEIPLVCDRDQQQGTQSAVPLDENGRRQLQQVEQKLQDTQKQFSELKSHLSDVKAAP